MSYQAKKRWTTFGALFGAGATLATIVGLGVAVGSGLAAGTTAAKNAQRPAVAGQETGCPGGSGPVNVNDVKSPARLLLDGQTGEPSVVNAGTSDIVLRYHVSACGGRPVQGALVYTTAVPFNQWSIPNEQPTGQDGWTELRLHQLRGFPVSPNQQLIALFARARKQGEPLLTGISTRRLFSLRVNLRG
jgi:hypothetical protein